MNPLGTEDYCFRYVVNLGHGKIDQILINSRSDPYVESSQFCAKHSLPSGVVTILGDQILREIQRQKHRKSEKHTQKHRQPQSGCVLRQRSRGPQSNIMQAEQPTKAFSSKSNLLGKAQHQTKVQTPAADLKRQVFDHLYRDHKQQLLKKQLIRKRSFEAIPFKPRINTVSGIIVAEKRKISTLSSQGSSLEGNRHLNCSLPRRGVSAESMARCSQEDIYTRGQAFVAKSKSKREKIRNQCEGKLMQDCTFRPRLSTRCR